MKRQLIVSALVLVSVWSANAEDEEKKKYKWSGTGQLGFTSTSGNSNADNITARLAVKVESGKLISDMSISILQASADGVDTADRFIVNSKTGYKYNEKNYFYYGSRYENDNFTGFDYVMTSGVGWGHKFKDTEKMRFITEIGLGYKIEALDIDRSENTGAAFITKLNYMQQLTATTSFENLTTIESTDINTFIQNDAGFSFKVSDKFKVKLAHQFRHNTDVPVNIKNSDSLVSANLVYDF